MQTTYSTIEVTSFTKEDIKRTLNLIPGELNTFKGATKFHEIFVNPQGVMRVKELPTDNSYKLSNITVKRIRGGVGGGRQVEIAVLREEVLE